MSSMSELQKIVGCVTTINNNHGRGDVIGVVMDENYKGGTVTLKLAKGGIETRRLGFNCSSNIVYYLAHQRAFSVMNPRQLFAQEYGAPLMDVNHFAQLGQQYAKLSTNECNGHPHPNAVDQKDKNECAKLWNAKAAVVAKQMTDLVRQWGFNHLDFGVGFYPTLQLTESQTEGTVMFPYDD